jgi:hypothetical protein
MKLIALLGLTAALLVVAPGMAEARRGGAGRPHAAAAGHHRAERGQRYAPAERWHHPRRHVASSPQFAPPQARHGRFHAVRPHHRPAPITHHPGQRHWR